MIKRIESLIQDAQPVSLVNSIKKRKQKGKQSLSAWMNSDYSSLDSRSQPMTSQSNGNLNNKGFPQCMLASQLTQIPISKAQIDLIEQGKVEEKEAEESKFQSFLKKQNLVNHNLNTLRLPKNYGMQQNSDYAGDKGEIKNKLEAQRGNYFSNFANKSQSINININQVKKQFLNFKDQEFNYKQLPRIGEKKEKKSSSAEDNPDSSSKIIDSPLEENESSFKSSNKKNLELPDKITLEEISNSKPKIKKRSTVQSSEPNTERSIKYHHSSDHLLEPNFRGRLIQHNLKGQNIPSLLKGQSEQLLSQSDTSHDSTDIQNKLTYQQKGDLQLSHEYIGIETGEDNSQNELNYNQNYEQSQRLRLSFEKKKVSKSNLGLNKKKKSTRSIGRTKMEGSLLNKSKNQDVWVNTLTKLKLNEINQSLLVNGKEKSFLDKFEKIDKQNSIQNFVENFQKYGKTLGQKRRSRSGSKPNGSLSKLISTSKQSKHVKSTSGLMSDTSKLIKTSKVQENPLNRSIELGQSMPRTKSSTQKKSQGKNPEANFSLFRTFVGNNLFSSRGASTQKKQ